MASRARPAQNRWRDGSTSKLNNPSRPARRADQTEHEVKQELSSRSATETELGEELKVLTGEYLSRFTGEWNNHLAVALKLNPVPAAVLGSSIPANPRSPA